MMRRLAKYLGVAALLIGFVAISVQLFPGTAYAAKSTYCNTARTTGGRTECNGYFTNTAGYVLPAGINLVNVISVGANKNNIDDFINHYSYYLNGNGGARDAMGAAFVILTMLGVSGPNAGGSVNAGINMARSRFSEWATLVRAYTTTPGYSINFNESYTAPAGYVNSAQLSSGSDVVYHRKAAAETIAVIAFHSPSGVVAMIQRNCSNMIGQSNNPPVPVNPDQLPQFNFDMDCSVIRGYAFDPDNMSTKLQVHVYVGDSARAGSTAVAVAVTANIDDGDPTPNVAGHIFRVDLTQEPFKSKVASGAQPVYIYTWSYNSAGTLIAGPYMINATVYGKTTVGPCVHATCDNGSSGMPAAMTVGQAYYLKPQADLSSAWGPPMHTGANGSGYDPRMHYTIQYSSNGGTTWIVVEDKDVIYDAGTVVAGPHLTANPTADLSGNNRGIKFTPASPGKYAIGWSLTGFGVVQGSNSGTISCGSPGSTTDLGKAGTQPYFSVIGGDIISGGNINAYNQNGTDVNGDVDNNARAGAGSNLAAIAGVTATNFATGIGLNTGVSTKSGAGLGFANASLGTNETAKGFVPLPSTPTIDLSGTHTNWAAVGNLSTCTTKCIYDVSGGSTISGTVLAGADITLYIASGDIYLGNIFYNYSSLDNIPRLTVYTASGNIIVAKGTTEIHGVFVAAGGGTKGHFYSCGIGVNAVGYQSPPADIGQCSAPLTVYGAVIANKLILTRIPGTYIPGQPNSDPAETFVFGPEVWLHRSTTTTSGGSSAPVFDQYFSLPPVL